MTTNWEFYLKSIEETYAQWWTCYTITDVVGKTRQRQQQGKANSPLLMGLTVRTVSEQKEESDNPNKSEEKEPKEKIEQFPILEGLRKYAPEQVLLIGRPGSGKSTALLRVLLEEARKSPAERLAAVSVLVELRYYQTDFLDLIRDFCKRHGKLLTREEVERLLFEKQLFLLVDGLNELPSEAARRDVMAFRQTYPTTPTIFTTRDLGVGGDLNITKKLTMQPLTEPQMQEFVRGYLGDGRMLAQLGSRLREFGQTPLLLWMLCSVFAENENQIPANLSSVFRYFCQIYAHQLKQDVPAAEESPEWWQPMLQQLAWVMTRGESATEIQVAISRQKAEAVLAEFLAGKVAHPAECARRWLKDLLKYHLLQLGAANQIEFRHQLIQEYYAAESLLQRLPSLGRDELKWEYLNYLKWTEPLALMLELVEEEALAVQVVQVVRWALEIDWELGARLAGAVQPQWQEQTMGLVYELNLPQFYLVELLEKARSEAAIFSLIKSLNNSDIEVYKRAAFVLSKTGSETAVFSLIKALKNSDPRIYESAAFILSQINSRIAILSLIKALENSKKDVCSSAAKAFLINGSDEAVPVLLKALKQSNRDVRSRTVETLVGIGSDAAISGLLKALEDSEKEVRRIAAEALGRIGSDTATSGLLKALEDSEKEVRRIAAEALGRIGSDTATSGLLKALEDSEKEVRGSAAEALVEISSEAVIPSLIHTLEDSDRDVRWSTTETLSEISSDTAISGLIHSLENPDFWVRMSTASALGQIGSQKVLFELTQRLKKLDFIQLYNGDSFRNAIQALKTVQEKLKYYQPLPKFTMSNLLSHHYALLIGIGNCEYPKWSLPVTVKDVRAFQSLLTDANLCGYVNDTEHLRLLHDSEATKEGIINSLNWLQQQTANDPEATVIIYYSGHGWLDETTQKYYLIPHDVDPLDIPNSALPADTFNQALQQIQAQKVLVIIDSCHAQGMATAKDATPLKLPPGFAATALPKSLAKTLSQGEGRAVFTSSKGNQSSYIRRDNSLSIFTYHFLEALQGAGNRPGDKAVMVSDLMNYVGKAVPDSAQTDYQAEQVPFFKFETEDFPVALLRGGKGLPQEGWEGVKAQAEEKIQKIGGDISNTVTGDVGNVVNINAGNVQFGNISAGKS
ncbi:MAG: HEAT repeat domain-containing protein [Cyanobacteriota bacterium]|nr:HEAT repeat domain-containing protein [Cyanobacteriota bacterium]